MLATRVPITHVSYIAAENMNSMLLPEYVETKTYNLKNSKQPCPPVLTVNKSYR